MLDRIIDNAATTILLDRATRDNGDVCHCAIMFLNDSDNVVNHGHVIGEPRQDLAGVGGSLLSGHRWR